MDFDELQARLAATEAKERKIFGYSKTDVARSEAEAADIRRTEFASLAQSKMGKHAQLDELTARVEKEQASAMEVRGRLEASMSDEQAHLIEWEKVPTLRRCTRAASRSIAHARSRSLPPPVILSSPPGGRTAAGGGAGEGKPCGSQVESEGARSREGAGGGGIAG